MSIRLLVQVLVLVVAVGATSLVGVSGVAEPSRPGVVRVEGGWLRGVVGADHVRYSGVPYAAPPVGELRWRAPAPVREWAGVLDATGASTPCPQREMQDVVGAEDCLFLDVTAPRGGERLPVLVWLHGGGFSSGGAREFDGVRLATGGGMVVVDINYRLGALGFLASPVLDGAGGNYGLMDQAAALRWVRRNVARFGGDPRNVTLAGQSAGARAVCAQLASPASRGLFDRAIMQSGACDNRVPTLVEAQEFGSRAVEALGCARADDIAGCLRGRTPDQLVGTLAGVGWAPNGRVADRPWNPVAETTVLPKQPGDALRDGSAARVPLLLGSNRDEMRSFVDAGTTEAEYGSMMVETFGGSAGLVLAEYPAGGYDSPAVALATVLTDWGGSVGACPVLRTARAATGRQPVYSYEFTEDSQQNPDGVPLGSYHGLELPYLWDLHMFWDPYPELTDEQVRLSAVIIGYWAAFVRDGDPNGGGRPRWPAFGSTGVVLGLSTGGIAPTPYAVNHRCDLWGGLPR